MRYQPNYCCNCGEKIERPNPSFTDSKMFCDVCKHDFVLPRALPVVFASVMALIGLFGLGSHWRGGEKTPHPASRTQAANVSGPNRNSAGKASPANLNANSPQPAPANNVQTIAPPAANPAFPPPAKPKNPAPAAEAVYFCGAETKKGTPCSRRVRGGGRCWQHTGQTAPAPSEKLLVDR